MKGKRVGVKQQRALQIMLAAGFVALVAVVDWVAVAPKGIYSTRSGQIGSFATGIDRGALLEIIDRQASIRAIDACGPQGSVVRSKARHFPMTPVLEQAAFWRCLDRKKGVYLFGFEGRILTRVVYLNARPQKDTTFGLFTRCFDSEPQLDAFLKTQTTYRILNGYNG